MGIENKRPRGEVREQLRREAKLFKQNKRGITKIHRRSFRDAKLTFIELTYEERQELKRLGK